MKPEVKWIFAVNSGIGLPDREEAVSAPIDADQVELEFGFFHAGYIRVNYKRKEWEQWAWPGGYPIYYVCEDGGILCPKCCNDNIELTTALDAERDWKIVAMDINYEDNMLYCDECGKHMESAYGEEDSCDRDEDAYQQEIEGREPSDAETFASVGWGTDEDYGNPEEML